VSRCSRQGAARDRRPEAERCLRTPGTRRVRRDVAPSAARGDRGRRAEP
jgi:hypothetical protein